MRYVPAPAPHDLRHAFITALDIGVALRDVQEAASHADPRTTMGYDRGRQSSTGTGTTARRIRNRRLANKLLGRLWWYLAATSPWTTTPSGQPLHAPPNRLPLDTRPARGVYIVATFIAGATR
jgi:hypothetical protein